MEKGSGVFARSTMMAGHTTSTSKRAKRPRRESSDGFSIEELSTDDMGYDGDVEVLHPDEYEEPESESGDNKSLWRVWPDTDDELAGRLRRLSWEPHGSTTTAPCRPRHKRTSQEMEDVDHGSPSPLGKRTVIEVSEVVDAKSGQPPLKRRKKRIPSKQSIAHRLMKKQAMAAWSDSSDKTDDHEAVLLSSDPCTPEPAPPPAHDDEDGVDAMDMG
ncbi:hypothetical protein ABEF93_007797 [Exophiala dermatitidis]